MRPTSNQVIQSLERFADTTDDWPLRFASFEQGEAWDDLMQTLNNYNPRNWGLILALVWLAGVWVLIITSVIAVVAWLT